MRTVAVTLLVVVVLAGAYLAFRGANTAPHRSLIPRGKPAADSSAVEPGFATENTQQESIAPGADDARTVVEVRAEGPTSSPGEGRYDAVVVLSIDPGWHVNANPASDEFLIPTEITLPEGAAAEIAGVEYPHAAKKKFTFSESPLAVYEGDVRIPVTLRIPDPVPAEIALDVTYQPCDDSRCLAPVTVAVSLKLPVRAALDRHGVEGPPEIQVAPNRVARIILEYQDLLSGMAGWHPSTALRMGSMTGKLSKALADRLGSRRRER